MSAGAVPMIGMLCDRVTVQRRMLDPEPGGGQAAIHVPLGKAWARVRSLPSRFGILDGHRASGASHSVVLRWRIDIAPGDRILYRGHRLDVLGTADLDGRRRYLAVSCTEAEVAP